jgi:hypothetical protein
MAASVLMMGFAVLSADPLYFWYGDEADRAD